MSCAAAAGPGGNRTAEVGACLKDAAPARVCSSKELTNVVLQCGDESSSAYIKYDDPDDTKAPIADLTPGSGAQWLPLACTDAEAGYTDGSDGRKIGGSPIEMAARLVDKP